MGPREAVPRSRVRRSHYVSYVWHQGRVPFLPPKNHCEPILHAIELPIAKLVTTRAFRQGPTLNFALNYKPDADRKYLGSSEFFPVKF